MSTVDQMKMTRKANEYSVKAVKNIEIGNSPTLAA